MVIIGTGSMRLRPARARVAGMGGHGRTAAPAAPETQRLGPAAHGLSTRPDQAHPQAGRSVTDLSAGYSNRGDGPHPVPDY